MPTTSWRPGNLPLPDHLSILMQNLKSNSAVGPESQDFSRHPWQRKECLRSQNPKRQSVRLGILLRRRDQRASARSPCAEVLQRSETSREILPTIKKD